MSAVINQKEYLKKYLSGGNKSEKKKKKKSKTKSKHLERIKIVDTDYGSLDKLKYDEEDGDDAPTIAEIIYDCEATKAMDEMPAKSDKWKSTLSDKVAKIRDQVPTSIQKTEWSSLRKEGKNSSKRKSRDDFKSPPRKIVRHDSESPPRKSIRHDSESPPRKSVRHDSESPPRKSIRHDSESPPRKSVGHDSESPPRKSVRHDSESPPRKTVRHDSESPPRKSIRHDSESPPRKSVQHDAESPPRKSVRHDSESPPRKSDMDNSQHKNRKSRFDSDECPPRSRRRHDSDASPPRNNKSRHDSDESPPRGRKSRHDSDESPPRNNMSRPDSDASPPRNRKSRPDSDESPPRNRKSHPDSDESPPRNRKSDRSPVRKNTRYDSDESPPRVSQVPKSDTSSNDPPKQGGREYGSMTTKEFLMARKRGKLKKDTPEDLARKDRERVLQEAAIAKNKEWRSGQVQVKVAEERADYVNTEMGKSFARTAEDVDMNTFLQGGVRKDDPMFEYLAQKKEKGSSGPRKPLYQGPFPPNRFNVRPGYRWDGVDRSTGFEKEFFQKQSSKKAVEEDAYKYCSEDM